MGLLVDARARSPAVAAVDELLRQHISSWIGSSNLVCAFSRLAR
jgi:hypothetical protein